MLKCEIFITYKNAQKIRENVVVDKKCLRNIWMAPKEINGKKSLVDCKPLVPEMSEEDVRKAVEPLILEYFENSDSMEVLFTLQVKN